MTASLSLPLVAPSQAFEGSQIEVRYSVTNLGIGATDRDSWTDTIWLTRDKNRPSPITRDTPPKPDDILLATFTHNGSLAVGEHYERAVNVTLPELITGEWYITAWSDAYNLVLEDSFDINANPDDPNELDSNNYKSRPITVLLTPPPDLVVTSVVPTAQAKGGEEFDVSWTVTNSGASATKDSEWFDTIYLSDSPTLNTPGATYWDLGTVKHSGALDKNSSYTGTLNTVLSPSAAGKYVIVKTNSRSSAWEGNYTSNNERSVAVDVTTAPADLVLTNVKTIAQNFSGERTTVAWTVQNVGGSMWAGTRYWYDELWISPDPTFIQQRATKVGFFAHSSEQPLGTGDSYTQVQEITLPAGFDGKYYIHISTDYSYDSYPYSKFRGTLAFDGGDNDSYRSSFEYRGFENPSNNLGSASIGITYREADLKVTNLIAPQSPPKSGEAIAVTWSVTNIGTRDTREDTWYDRVYLSRDQSLDSSDSMLGEVRHTNGLKMGSAYTQTANVTLPDGIDGDFYLLVFTDSNVSKGYGDKKVDFEYYPISRTAARVPEFQDEGNNITAVSMPVVLSDAPDLQVTSIVTPERSLVGQPINLIYTVTNAGTGNTPNRQSSWDDLIYLSRDQFLDLQSDIYLDYSLHTGGLAAGDRYTVSKTLNLPTNLTGPFYVFVVTDPTRQDKRGKVFEGSNENNNATPSTQPLIIELPPPSDLQVDEIKMPATAISGDKVQLDWTVTNRGTNSATGQWNDAAYLSTDAIWDINDVLVGRTSFSGTLAAGASYTSKLETTLPPAIPGQYRLIVRPDIFNTVYEAQNEANNKTASANTLNVSVPNLQLGAPLDITLSTGQSRLYQIEVTAGQTLQIDLTSSATSAANEIFVRFEAAPTTTLYDAAYKGTLAANQTAIVPTTKPGTYYILVKGQSEPSNNTPAKLLAKVLPFSITDVKTDRGGDSRYVTANIFGASFSSNAIVKLVRPGVAEYNPVNYKVVDSTNITAIFDLTNAPHGLYDVKVINPDGTEAILPYRYLVERTIEPDVSVGLGGTRVLAPGDTGTYGVSVRSLTNIDTPYVHFQFGIPELGTNGDVFNLPYTTFSSNLRGSPENAAKDVPWASLVSDVNTQGEILAPGYAFDLPTGEFVGQTFNVQTYQGLQLVAEKQGKTVSQLLQELKDDGVSDDQIAFTFHILATATALTREEFVAQQTTEALRLRKAILRDRTASQALMVLAADANTWTSAYLAALETAGLLRAELAAPPVRQDPLVVSLMATLAAGVLIGPVGEQIISDGDLMSFFTQIRKWYGHDAGAIGQALPPNASNFNLGLSKQTHFEAFKVYVPYGEARVDLPASVAVPQPDFSRFFNAQGGVSNDAAIAGPLGYGNENFVPQGEALPYTIQFENAATSASSVGEVRIVTKLDADLDPRTFTLGDLRLGDIQIHIPAGRGAFQGEFDFTRSKGFVLRVSAGLDPLSNTATWLLQAIDPQTGEVIANPSIGLLPPNTPSGGGKGFVSYTVLPQKDLATGTEITSSARIIYNTAAPFDTPQVTNMLDGVAPTTTLTAKPLVNGGNDHQVQWQAVDDAGGSGVKHVTVYVAEDGGNFTIWQQQTNATSGIYTGRVGHTYEFIALATDNAGNQEQPRFGVTTPSDGSGVNLGTLPTFNRTTPDLGPAPAPSSAPATNQLFVAAEKAIPNTPPVTKKSEFTSVLRPFAASAFATGINQSGADIGPLAIAVLADNSVIFSGGTNRGSLFRMGATGGAVTSPIATLPYPVFDLAVGSNGNLWATTGGGPLLEIDAQTGEILHQYGDSITQSLAIQSQTGLIYVSSGNGIEVFNPVTKSFSHYSDLRVGNLAFAPDGSLWAATWPGRGDIVRFDAQGKPQKMLHFDSSVDSLAFGQTGTKLEGLLFVSNNDGKLVMVDVATLRHVTVASGGSRGDIVETTADGRVLLSQSHQIDVLLPIQTPHVIGTNPPDDATIALPKGNFSVTFDTDMFVGSPSSTASVTNPNNYVLTGKTAGRVAILSVDYDASTRTAQLNFDAIADDYYQLQVANSITSAAAVTLEAAYSSDFVAVSDFLPYVDLSFTNPRSNRADSTISYDVTLTNRADHDLILPLLLGLEPGQYFTGKPIDAVGFTQSGGYLIDLSADLPNGRLKAGESITSRTITVSDPEFLRIDFAESVYALPYPNAAPIFTSTPVTSVAANGLYQYKATAIDPDGAVLSYLLLEGAAGMSVDTSTGVLTWQPTEASSAANKVILQVYDSRGGHAAQEFTLNVAGGDRSPVFTNLPKEVKATEGKLLELAISATDADKDRLIYWVDNLPAGALFDAEKRKLIWTPSFSAAGTYNVRFNVSDGLQTVSQITTVLVAPKNQAPTISGTRDITVREGEKVRLQLQGSDPEKAALTFSSNLLPGGAVINPTTGLFEWTPSYFQAGEFEIPFSVSDGTTITTKKAKINVLNVNAAPVFDSLDNWQVTEGQTVRFRAFALDPDNPSFIPQDRTSDGSLTLLEGSQPSVTYTVTGLPIGASFDPETAVFSWTTGFAAAGIYDVTFTATDDGNGTGIVRSSQVTVPIEIANLNRSPIIAPVSNRTLRSGEVINVLISTTDPDGNPISLTAAGLTGYGLPSFVSFTDNGNGTALLHLAPGTDNGGNYAITLKATDNGDGDSSAALSDEYEFIVSVDSPNAAPHLSFIGDKVAVVGKTMQFIVRASDRNQDALTFSTTGLPTGATLTPTATYGSALFQWTPTAADIGTKAITISVKDSGNGNASYVLGDTATFNLVVRDRNTAPVLAILNNPTISESQALTLQLLATDANSDVLTYTASNLPTGAKLDPVTGVLTWTPNNLQAGVYAGITLTASDGDLSSTQTIDLTVNNVNQAPVLAPLHKQSGRENSLLQFTLAGTDIDGEALTYSALNPLPVGMTLDARTGQVRWTPGYASAGEYLLKFAATDANGASDVIDVAVKIDNVNRAPQLTSSHHAVALGKSFDFSLSGSDLDSGTNLTYSAIDLPTGAVLDATTGRFTWTPQPGQIGNYTVKFAVSDGELETTQSVLLQVAIAPQAPAVKVELTPGFTTTPGQTIALQAIADSLVDIANITVMVDGQAITLDALGRGQFVPATSGTFNVVATATDVDGLVGHNSVVIKVRDPQDNSPPVVNFAPGLAGTKITTNFEVVGTVGDINLDSWQLEIADKGSDKFTVIASGETTQEVQALANIDPNKIANGFYTLRLTATDISDRTSVTTAEIEVNSSSKTGQYQKVETDLSVAIGSTTVNITRAYSSLAADELETFGYGWRLVNTDTDIQTNVPETGREASGAYNPLRVGSRLYLTTPEGDRVGFTFKPEAHSIKGLTYYTPAWVADAGVSYKLQSVAAKLTLAGDRLYDLKSARAYNPADDFFAGFDYTLTASDGTFYRLSSNRGVEEQITSSGTRLIYSDSGITSSRGETISFVRDEQGRVTQIIAPDGSKVVYDYDEAGNLIAARKLAVSESHRYGYEQDGLLTVAVAPPGEASAAISYSDTTPQILPVVADLGSASKFVGTVTDGQLENGNRDRYTFTLRSGEISSTATGRVLVGLEIGGDSALQPLLPNISDLNALTTQVDSDSAYGLYVIAREGLNLIELSSNGSGNYWFQLTVLGDVNRDGKVDGVDSGLLLPYLGSVAGDGKYAVSYDFNRDGAIDAGDVQILGSNFGFTANTAPVVTYTTVLTHEDLQATVDLSKLATDAEGDAVFWRVVNPLHGTVKLSNDGLSALFLPTDGFVGTASFDLIADDGYSASLPTTVTVNVSGAALVNLDFIKRNPRLEVGESSNLIVIGDFVDQQDVLLTGGYVTFGSENGAISSISADGRVTGLADGATILSATRGQIQAVTATRIGSFAPTNDAELNVAIAEAYGLNLYPQAVTLTQDVERKMYVTLKGQNDSPNLEASSNGTRYFVSNPDIVSVSADGVITTLDEGIANVTVIYGASEFVVPVRVETPHIGTTTLGIDGGVVQGSDGSQVMVAEGALAEDTPVSITKLQLEDLTLPIPENYAFEGAFKLELGDKSLKLPVQLAIPAPVGLAVGTEVFFMHAGEIPDANGVWSPGWIVEESGVVGSDGMIRTSSPPWPGVASGGTYIIAVPKFEYRIGLVIPDTSRQVLEIAKTMIKDVVENVIEDGVDKEAAVKVAFANGLIFGTLLAMPFIIEKETITTSTLDVVAIPTVGRLPYITTVGVELNPRGIPTATVKLDIPTSDDSDPFAHPVISKAEFNFNNDEPLVYLTGKNFLNGSDDLGSKFEDLVVNFRIGDKTDTGTVVAELSQKLADDSYTLAVRPPKTVALGESSIELVRPQKERRGSNSSDGEVVEYKSKKHIELKPQDVDLALVTQVWGDTVTVINTANPEDILATDGLTSRDLVLAKIPVGLPDVREEGARDAAVTSNATRAYVPLEYSGLVSVIDLMTLQQIDTNSETELVDPINLRLTNPSAAPRSIAIEPKDRYAYIADSQVGTIYVLDIDHNSATYHQLVQTINVGTMGLNALAINSDGTKLFATTRRGANSSTGQIFVINIDPNDRHKDWRTNSINPRKWHQLIGTVDAVEAGTEGLAATNNPQQMVFTRTGLDAHGFGVLTITSDDPTSFAATTSYTGVGIGSAFDYFDVNDARAAVITKDGKYAFVAGFNGRQFGSGIPSVDGPLAGGNIGIIVDPLTDHARLIAATRPIPMGLTKDLVLSGDDKYLTAVYPGVGSVFMFDVEEIIATLANPGGDLSSVPIDDLNPNISIASDLVPFLVAGEGYDFVVPEGSNRAPLTIGNNPWSITSVSYSDWLDLNPVSTTGYTEDLTPTLSWQFDGDRDVDEVNVFVSTFDAGEGLLPWDKLVDLNDSSFLPSLTLQEKEELLTEPWHGLEDYNPGRILTATWKKSTNQWTLADGTIISSASANDPTNSVTSLTLPDSMKLTTGGQLNWAVQATDTLGRSEVETGKFDTVAPLSADPFSSVSILTQGFTIDPTPTGVSDWVYSMGETIVESTGNTANQKGLLLRFEKKTGAWVPVNDKGEELTLITGGLSTSDTNYWSNLATNIKTFYQHKPLVLMSEWSLGRESVIPDSGFTEGAADDLFAAMVRLDQFLGGGVGKLDANGQTRIYDDEGQLIRTQGDIFNSPLHFIGHSRGTVVNSEIIQRVGTYFPYAGGKVDENGKPVVGDDGKPVRDLQMTTLDPHDFNQPSLAANFKDFQEPKIQIWDNITFADNYYQTLGFEDGFTATPNGRDLPNLPKAELDKNPLPAGLNFLKDAQGRLLGQPDFSLNMNGMTGFFLNPKNQLGDPHGEVMNWYAKTVDINLDSIGVDGRFTNQPGNSSPTTAIYDRLGEQDLGSLLGNATTVLPWFNREGSGQGWYYSVLGGGKSNRPHSDVAKVPVSWDNTLNARMRGDFAVPTLFNGNFDASFEKPLATINPLNSSLQRNKAPFFGSTAVAGWSFRNNALGATWEDNAASTKNLVDWKDIPTLNQPLIDVDNQGNQQSYLQRLNIAPNAADYQPNYAIKLDNVNNSITHNRFLVPDWGALRFDLHVPIPDPATAAQNSVVRVFLDGQELQSSAFQGTQKGYPGVTDSEYSAVDLREFELKKRKDATETLGQENRIGFAKQGFQTFQVDIPNEFRGKVATLEFRLNGGRTVYLDNVFFKSQHLLFGAPALNGQSARKDVDTPKFNESYSDFIEKDPDSQFADNYLLEKPQYSLSYNSKLKTPNWVSYQLNETWLGTYSNSKVTFQNDPHSPFAIKVKDEDILDASNYQKGHMSAAADRSRNEQDYKTTFLTSNIIPMPTKKPNGDPWTNLEGDLRNFVKNQGGELYVVAGRYGQEVDKFGNPLLLPDFDPNKNYDPNDLSDFPYKISVPESVWKVVLVLDKPGQGIYDVTKDTLAFAINLDNTLDSNNQARYIDGDWTKTNITTSRLPIGLINIDKLEEITGYDFLSNLPAEIQEAIEGRKYPDILEGIYDKEIKIRPRSASLMASATREATNIWTLFDSSIGHNSIPNQISMTTDIISGDVDILEVSINQNSMGKTKTRQLTTSEIGTSSIHVIQNGISQISFNQTTPKQISRIQLGFSENSTFQTRFLQNSSSEIDTTEIDTTEIDTTEIGTTQVNSLQIDPFKVIPFNVESNTSKVPLSLTVSNHQFFSIHNSIPTSINTYKDNLLNYCSTLFEPTFNITFSFTDLPTGQLAEAQITEYDSLGRPVSGNILIDSDANGKGWFIDPTPFDNSEFTNTLDHTAYSAAPNSAAFGHYDLLTALLHEMGHLAGFISGYREFDRHIQTRDGSSLFITPDGISAAIVGDHLDPKLYPYDLLSPVLTTGMRKLPSLLDAQLLAAINSSYAGNWSVEDKENTAALNALLTSTPLAAQIFNGTFDSANPTNPNYGWSTRGDSTIAQGQAILGEGDRFNSNFSQSFTIPEGAKYLQFTLTGTQLGASTKYDPSDAFEVALLDANTLTPLAGTVTGLSQTDALLNIQHDGKAYLSPFVKLKGGTANDTLTLDAPMTFTVDVTGIAPGTEAKLYFDLLGFGDRNAQVTLDDVRLISGNAIAPTATNDTAITNQATPIALNVLANDSDIDGTINPTTIVNTNPLNGTVAINSIGEITYTPNANFIGTDYFIYTVKDDQGEISNPATVTIQVNNVLPTISNIEIQADITEGTTATFKAIASDSTDDLTYTWNFGDGSDSAIGQTVNHTFSDNGNYTATLTITDTFGANTTQVFSVVVANAAPVITAGSDRTVNEGEAIAFNGSFTDLGILDTHTIAWDFGDGTALVDTLNPTHTYSDNGIYTVNLSVTDNNGDRSTNSLTVNVNNLAPAITDVAKDTNISEGVVAAFRAVATDPGDDTLTYTWNFGDGSDIVTGKAVNHTFTNNGLYTTTLIVIDSDGDYTSQTLLVDVANVAPVVTAVSDRASATEGDVINFTGSFTDAGILDTHTILWDFGDGATESGILNPTHTYADNGIYTATISVTDNDGATSKQAVTVKVTNAAPVVTATSSSTSATEGDAIKFNASFTDIGIIDTHTILWDFGDGATASGILNPTHTYADNGTYTATISVTDNDGANSKQAVTVKVTNAVPIVIAISDRTSATEGDTVKFNGSFTDAGVLDKHAILWDFGDGTTSSGILNPNHTYADNGTYTATLSITDNDGAIGRQAVTVKVTNAAPIVTATSDRAVAVEGDAIKFSGSFTDAGVLDKHTILWDFGDGTTEAGILNSTHIYADNGIYTATLSITDNDGATSKQSVTVKVTNAAPIVIATSSSTLAVEGDAIKFNGSFSDAGSLDTHTVNWDFGDGTTLVGILNPNHVYADNGIYTATLSITDNDGATSKQAVTVKVINAAPIVTAISSSTSATEGDAIKFNGSFTDVGKLDTHTINWDFGDGTNASGILNPTHIYADNGIYTATLSVTDNDGATSISSVKVNVANAAPIVDAGLDRTVSIGESLSFNGSFTDTGKLDTHTIVWDFGDGTSANTLQANHTYSKDGNYTVKLSVTDNAGSTTSDTLSVVVKPLPTLVIEDRTIVEGNDGTSSAMFTVSLSMPSTKPITVNYATADVTATAGNDYTATSGTLTFAPGTTSQTIAIAVKGDCVDEVDETFSINLTGATNATIIDAQGVGTIVDDDEPPTLTIGNKTIVEGDNGSTIAVFSVSLSALSAQSVSVNYATADGSATAGNDYTANSGILTFAPGSTTATISVQVDGDRIDESDETFSLNLSNATNATIAQSQAVVTIVDNDAPPALTIDDQTIVEGSNGITYAVMTVSLSAVSGQTVKVNYATANGSATAGSDYTASSGTLTFAPGQTSQTIKVAINGDRIDEVDEAFFVNLSNAINATIADAQAKATIVDDDASPLLKVSANPPSLWPPNHKMVEIQVNVAVSDDFDANPTVKLVSITSNEPDNGLGDGDTAKDIDIRPDGRIFLRAERSGTGTGRVYTLIYSATDSAGNVTYSTTEVRVPLNQGK